jgi:hypothetical protein
MHAIEGAKRYPSKCSRFAGWPGISHTQRTADNQQRPNNGAGSCANKPQRQNQGQRERRHADDQGLGIMPARQALGSQDLGVIVRIFVAPQELPGRPLADEVPIRGIVAGQSEGQKRDSGSGQGDSKKFADHGSLKTNQTYLKFPNRAERVAS